MDLRRKEVPVALAYWGNDMRLPIELRCTSALSDLNAAFIDCKTAGSHLGEQCGGLGT